MEKMHRKNICMVRDNKIVYPSWVMSLTSMITHHKANVIGACVTASGDLWLITTAGDSFHAHYSYTLRNARFFSLHAHLFGLIKRYCSWKLDNCLSREVTMDCSEEVQSLSDGASTPIELKKGMSIFLDVSIFFTNIVWLQYRINVLNDNMKMET